MRASIIIAAHNEGEALWRTVRACIETCSGLDYEIVIADDASLDGSVQEVQRRFPRLRLVRHEERRGASPTKDRGTREARGNVLVFLDGHCNPEHGAIERLVRDVEETKGNAVITPAIAGLDVQRWRNSPSQIGHGYFLDLEKFDCGWLPLSELRAVNIGRRRFYESPALIGCALAVSRELYEDLWGFDRHMRLWGVEDLDFGLKAWLMGHAILHDPEAVIGHRFRASFDNYEVPVEHTVVNQLRMARKNFTHGVWSQWLDRCRMRHPGRLHDHPEGLWARVWEVFEEQRASVEQERAYLHARRLRDEFWYAERFGLTWPRLRSAPLAPTSVPAGTAATPAEVTAMATSPSPSPPPGPPVIQPGFPPGQPIACQATCPGGCGVGGIPQWNLNLFSLNLILRDTPAFYSPGLGPKISWDLTFNSQDPNASVSPFTYLLGAGVWSPYQTHVIDLGTQARVVMPDGREDYYLPVNLDTNPIVYTPYSGTGIYNQLTKNTTTNQFQLVLTDHTVLTFGQQFTSAGTSYYAVTRIADNVGNAVTLTYTSDAVPKLSTVTDANGNVSQVVYNSAGQASQINDPFGGNMQLSYTAVGGLTRLASITDQAGYTSLLTYDSNARLTALTTPLTSPSPTWQFAYSGTTNQISSITGPDGQTTRYSMTSTTTTVTDPLGRQTVYDFSNNSFGGAGTTTNALGNATQQQFDSNRNVTRLINARGYFSDYTYDSQGNRLTERDYLTPYPDTSQYVDRSWTYDSNNNVLSATDPAGTESWTYNANNQMLTFTDKLGHTTTNTYTSQGLLQTVTDRNGIVAVTNTYDSNGRRISTADALGNTTQFQWDSRGRQTAVTDPDRNTTSFAYDLLNRLMVTTFPDSTTIQNSYNCCTLTQTTDQNGNTIQFVYDDYNRLIKKTDQTGAVVQQAYDAVGNLVSLTDPNNHTWQWQYDALNRRIKELDPLGNQRSWTYDAMGNMASRTDGNGATTNYSYDALNRLIRTSYPDGTSVVITYDAVGNRLTLTSSTGQWTWTYDALGRVTSELTPAASNASQYQYDNEDNRTAVIDPDGNQTSYVYDNAYRISSISFPVGSQNLTASYQYNGRGLVTARTLPNGVQSSYNYDSLGRATQIQHSQAGGTVLTQLAYQYDAVGDPTSETGLRWDTSQGTTFPYQVQYGYDARQELTSEGYYLNNTLTLEMDYTYDAAGNRGSRVTTIPGSSDSPVTVDSTYETDNQIATSVRSAPQDPTQTTTYSEDANGNLTAQAAPSGSTSYSYDFENRLTNVALPSGTNVQFVYNGDDLRIQKTDAGGVVTKYVLDQLNVLLEKNSSGLTTARYVPAVALITGSDVRYYLEERLGSVVALVDSTQTVTDTFRYDAWGNLLAQQGSTATPYQWDGNEAYYLNSDVGFYLLGLRFYSPLLSRFVTRDPRGFQSDDLSQYRYVLNQPNVLVDPTGLDEFLQGLSETTHALRCLKQLADGLAYESIPPSTRFNVDPKACMRIYSNRSSRKKRWYCKCKVNGVNIPADCQSFYYGSGNTEAEAKRDATSAAAAEGCHNPGAGYKCTHHDCREKPFGN